MAYLASSAKYAARQASATPTIAAAVAYGVGDISVIYYGHDTSTSDTVPTDSLGTTYTFLQTRTDANFNIHRLCAGRITSAGTPVITLHLPGTPSAGGIMIGAYTGRATSSFVTDSDQNEQAIPLITPDAVTCPALTTGAGDDVVYFVVGPNGNTAVYTAGTNFVERLEQGGAPGTDFDVMISDRVNVGGGSITPVATTSDTNYIVSMALSLAPAAAAGGALYEAGVKNPIYNTLLRM